MNAAPRVTVVIPVYNVCSYLEATLVSLEQQSFQAFEAIVVDDGSTDDSAQVAQVFCQRDARFRLVAKPNGGLSSARNFGIRHAQTDYIAMLDGDDLYEPKKLENHVNWLDRDASIGVVYSASKTIRDDGKLTMLTLSGKPILSDPLLALLCKNFVGHGSNAVFRRSLIGQVGGFDETLRSSEDLDFWLRIAATEKWSFYREPRTLSRYRVRPSGLSFDVAQMQRSHERVLQSAYQRSPECIEPYLPMAYAYLYRFLARLSMTAGNTEQARQFIAQALASDQSIFYRDPRSLLTLLSVQFAPLAKRVIGRSLGSAKSVQSKNL